MRVLMADTVYDKINLRTRFVAPINRGGWTLMCSVAGRARIPFYKYFLQNFQILVTNFQISVTNLIQMMVLRISLGR